MNTALSIIVINYNTFELTSKCIQSIYNNVKDIPYEIILVDNASSEKDAESFKNIFPDIKLIKSQVNSGFAKGNNIGIQQAKGKYILLLNSDCELLNNAPLISLRHMESYPDCGISTVRLQYPNGKIQFNCRKFRTISWELLEVFPLYILLPKNKREELMLHHYFSHDKQIDCDWVWGTYMFIRAETIKRLPEQKLAEDFFMYCEDVLWCWQIKQLGLKITFLPEGRVMHVHKGSSTGNSKKINKVILKNHTMFMKRIYPDWRWYIFKLIYLAKQKIIALLSK
jgi:GT2 family glycosyltransferase